MRRALVLATAAVVFVGTAAFADVLSGTWSTDVCMDQSGTFTSFDSLLDITYAVCDWAFGAQFEFTGSGGWETASFNAHGLLGAFVFESTIAFDPSAAAFQYWVTEITLSISGVDLELAIHMDDAPSVDFGIGLFGDVGLCTLGVEALFGQPPESEGCTLLLEGICFDFGFPFSCVEWIDVSACFGCGTFEGICFDIVGLQLAGIDWLIYALEICFDDGEAGKTFTFTPALSLEAYDCITLYAELVEGADFEFDGINVYGVEIYYEWSDGVYFQSVTSFEDAKNLALIGYADYWEKICIGTVGDSCCGGGFDFSLCVYFMETSTYLFDVQMIEADLAFGIGSSAMITASIAFDVLGSVEFCLGFVFGW